jgi:hypothetical protein
MPDHPVIDKADEFRASLLLRERATATRLIRAYGNIYQRLQTSIEALDAEIAAMDEPTAAQIARLSRMKALKKQVVSEIDNYAIYASEEIQIAISEIIDEAASHAEQLTLLNFPPAVHSAILTDWNRVPHAAIRSLLGMLAPDGPMHAALVEHMGAEVAAAVEQSLLDGLALGYNPRKVAQIMNRTLGQALTWALRTARTAQLYAYREATRANYAANEDIVKGWIWHAELDDNVCMSCVAMHGSFHKNSEILNDHHNGRCAMVPVTKSWKELGFKGIPETGVNPDEWQDAGQRWFDGLSEGEQQGLFGNKSLYEAFRSGDVSWSDLSREKDDHVYGVMRSVPSLKELLGEAAKPYYRIKEPA